MKPLTDYYQTRRSQPAAVADAFFAAFGTTADDPATQTSPRRHAGVPGRPASTIFSRPCLDNKLVGGIRSDVKSRISPRARRDLHDSNDIAIRRLPKAYAMIADLGIQNLKRPPTGCRQTRPRVPQVRRCRIWQTSSHVSALPKNASERQRKDVDPDRHHANNISLLEAWNPTRRRRGFRR